MFINFNVHTWWKMFWEKSSVIAFLSSNRSGLIIFQSASLQTLQTAMLQYHSSLVNSIDCREVKTAGWLLHYIWNMNTLFELEHLMFVGK